MTWHFSVSQTAPLQINCLCPVYTILLFLFVCTDIFDNKYINITRFHSHILNKRPRANGTNSFWLLIAELQSPGLFLRRWFLTVLIPVEYSLVCYIHLWRPFFSTSTNFLSPLLFRCFSVRSGLFTFWYKWRWVEIVSFGKRILLSAFTSPPSLQHVFETYGPFYRE